MLLSNKQRHAHDEHNRLLHGASADFMEADDVRVHQQPVVQDFPIHIDVDLQLSTMSSVSELVPVIHGTHSNTRTLKFLTMPPRSMNLPATSSPVARLRSSIVMP